MYFSDHKICCKLMYINNLYMKCARSGFICTHYCIIHNFNNIWRIAISRIINNIKISLSISNDCLSNIPLNISLTDYNSFFLRKIEWIQISVSIVHVPFSTEIWNYFGYVSCSTFCRRDAFSLDLYLRIFMQVNLRFSFVWMTIGLLITFYIFNFLTSSQKNASVEFHFYKDIFY